MKVYFYPKEGRRVRARVPFEGCDYVFATGSCPHCGAHFGTGTFKFKIQGKPGSMHRGHDRYTSTALCVECREVVGEIVAVTNTIFGIEEDEIMAAGGPNGIARVY